MTLLAFALNLASGVMFPVECKNGLPVDHMLLTSFSVRGELGPLTVWVSKEDQERKALVDPSTSSTSPAHSASMATARNQSGAALVSPTASLQSVAQSGRRTHARGSCSRSSDQAAKRNSMQISIHPNHWDKVYERLHAPSMHRFVDLILELPIKLRPNEIKGVYIHSALPGDESIVYDNQKSQYTHDDDFLQIRPGLAHLCNQPFGRNTMWGYGSAWRDSREFVGRVSYGIVYKLWNPENHLDFGPAFQKTAVTLFLCQRRSECIISHLPDDVIFYILNMCRWDWFNDTSEELRRQKESRKMAAEQDQKKSAASSVESDEDMDKDVARRASRVRGHWSSRSLHSISARSIRGMLLGTVGSANDVSFVNDGESDEESSTFDFHRYYMLTHGVATEHDDDEEDWNPDDD